MTWVQEIVHYRDLFLFLVLRDIKIRYKQTLLGVLWALIQPFCSMVVLTLFFGRVAGIGSDGTPYPVFVYSALVPWTYFSTALSASALSLVANSNLLTKIYFPRVAIPAAPVLAGLLDFGVAAAFLVALMPYYGMSLQAALLLWPVLVVPLSLLAFGLGTISACLNVRYRDMKYALPFLVQMLLFATPIIYPLDFIPDSYRWLAALNPLTGIIEAFRASVISVRPLDAKLLGLSLAETAVIVGLAIFYLRRTERVIADIV
jgi:lipopolysaccharide transport system permease protein